jgi:hypothetical protein
MQPNFSPITDAVTSNVPLLVFIVVFIGVLQIAGKLMTRGSRRGRWRGRRQGWRDNRNVVAFSPRHDVVPKSSVPDAADQLRIVMAAEFRPKRLLNRARNGCWRRWSRSSPNWRPAGGCGAR